MSATHTELLTKFKTLIRMSRNKMQQKYADWDTYDNVYRGVLVELETELEKRKKTQEDKNAPAKMVVPLAFAQIQTFVAFGHALFNQKEFFYELVGAAPEDFKASRVGEALLQRDLDYNKFTVILNQFMVDIGKFGLGVMKVHWTEEKIAVMEEIPAESVNVLGMQVPLSNPNKVWVQKTKYQGNRLENITPYRFFPDPRLPMTRFQEGEFVASETDYSYAELKTLEAAGVVRGLEYVTKSKRDKEEPNRRHGVDTVDNNEAQLNGATPNYVITELEIKLVPSTTIIQGEPLGEENFPIKFLVWIANDDRIVRFEPLNYLHDDFTYVVAELQPDMNHFFNGGWGEVISVLQDTVNWFINSHITSVRKVLTNRLIVDPEGVEMEDLKQHKAIIRLRPGYARNGIDRWVKQLDTQDATGGHVGDAQVIKGLMQEITGINDSILGQFASGRRSAAEARNVMGSASSRLKSVYSLIYAQALDPLGRQMLSNLRDGLSTDTFVRMFGQAATPDEYVQFKKVSRADLVGDYDFTIFDSTLPSEKSFQADVLKEFLIALLGNPEAISLLGLDPKLMAYEIMRNKGIRYPERFAIVLNPAMQQAAMQQQLLQQNGQVQTNPIQQTPSGGAAQVPQGMVAQPGDGASV